MIRCLALDRQTLLGRYNWFKCGDGKHIPAHRRLFVRFHFKIVHKAIDQYLNDFPLDISSIALTRLNVGHTATTFYCFWDWYKVEFSRYMSSRGIVFEQTQSNSFVMEYIYKKCIELRGNVVSRWFVVLSIVWMNLCVDEFMGYIFYVYVSGKYYIYIYFGDINYCSRVSYNLIRIGYVI